MTMEPPSIPRESLVKVPGIGHLTPQVRAAEQAQKKMQRLMQKEAEARQVSKFDSSGVELCKMVIQSGYGKPEFTMGYPHCNVELYSNQLWGYYWGCFVSSHIRFKK